MIENPKVSVCMITYNHERFIAQAIESVLEQKTTFDFELVIGEDCSTDETGKIVMSYAEKYPDKVRAIFREKNIGATHNFINTLNQCRGQYVALLEGDDYWIDPMKLELQIRVMEGNEKEAYCGCFHNNYIKFPDGRFQKKHRIQLTKTIRQHNMLFSCLPHTSLFYSAGNHCLRNGPIGFMTI